MIQDIGSSVLGCSPNCNLRIGKWGQGSHTEFRFGGEDGKRKREPTFLTLTSAECYFIEVQKLSCNNRHPNSNTIMQIQPPLHLVRLSGWHALQTICVTTFSSDWHHCSLGPVPRKCVSALLSSSSPIVHLCIALALYCSLSFWLPRHGIKRQTNQL